MLPAVLRIELVSVAGGQECTFTPWGVYFFDFSPSLLQNVGQHSAYSWRRDHVLAAGILLTVDVQEESAFLCDTGKGTKICLWEVIAGSI